MPWKREMKSVFNFSKPINRTLRTSNDFIPLPIGWDNIGEGATESQHISKHIVLLYVVIYT